MKFIERIIPTARMLGEKAHLIAPTQSSEVTDEVAAFAPFRRRPWLPLVVLAAVAVVGIKLVAAGGESEKDVTHILQAKPADPGPVRDIRARMREAAEKEAQAEKARRAAQKKAQAAAEEQPAETTARLRAEIDTTQGNDDLIAAVKKAAAEQK